MKSLRKALVLLLALAWVPLTSHCLIEAVSGLEFLSCETELPASPEGTARGEEGACCPVEFAKYQSPRQPELVVPAVLAVMPAVGFDFVEPLSPTGVDCGSAPPAPPDLPVPWQFVLRTALPARAPSLIS